MDFGAVANTRRWKVDIQRGPSSQCCFNQQGNCFNIDGLFTSIPFFLIKKYSSLDNLVWGSLGQNNNWLFCKYLLSSSSSPLANVSVLSKLVKFLHHINPTRQYPACVLSTHIENATFAGKPARSYKYFSFTGEYSYRLFYVKKAKN